MSFISAFRLAVGILLAHKGRTFLTCLGIVIGIGAVVALVSAGDGARSKLDDRLESAGKNLIIIRPGGRNNSGMITDVSPLTLQDVEAIRKEVGSLILGVVPWQVAQRPVSSASGRGTTIVVGSDPDFQRVCSWQVAQGRLFDRTELQKGALVCLLGQTVLHDLFPGRDNPVGEKIMIGAVQVRVIGVLASKGYTPLGMDQDDQIFMPLTAVQHKIVGKESIALLLATARSDDVVDEAQRAIIQVLRKQHHLRTAAGNDFDVANVRELANFAVTLGETLELLVAFIASIALVVGGIGIMNIMLVSVTERTREIGIRMATGATPANILVQFLLEALVLALLGGLVGVLLGLGGAAALAYLIDWPLVISPGTVLLAFAVTAAVGVFFGYYPAWRASRLDPIEALRHE